MITGFIPVSCIALNVFHFLPLHFTVFFIAMHAFMLVLFSGIKYERIGKIALRGWISGLVAVMLYDCARVPFILQDGMTLFLKLATGFYSRKELISGWVICGDI